MPDVRGGARGRGGKSGLTGDDRDGPRADRPETEATARVGDPEAAVQPTGRSASAQQIRGSSLLLVGRLLSMATNFGVTVLTVRYLAKSDYGAFAYALSIVSLGETVVTLGLDRAITRFIPIYEERQEYHKLWGTLVMVIGVVAGLGLGICLLMVGLQSWIGGTLITERQVVSLLVILIILSPVQALDGVLLGMFSVFSKPSAIFFRRHVLGPVLKLTVVLLLVLNHAGIEFLAVGYVLAGTAGVAISAGILMWMLRTRGLLAHLSWRRLNMPLVEVFSFTIPLLTSDLVYAVMDTTNSVLLGRYGGTTEVAAFRAVLPAARLNQVVFTSFTLLFTPLAARMFARDDREGINEFYWQTAIWLAIFSFPIFALTSSLARPITVMLYGARYESSAVYLALMSVGYYFNAALGFNGLTLKVFGILRYIVALNVGATLVNLGLNFLLIPRYGAFGAAVGTCGTLIAHNILKQVGLRFGTGINIFDWRYRRIYLVIAASAVALWQVQVWASPNSVVAIGLAALASLVVFRMGRNQLNIAEIFPELLRLPLARRLLGISGGRRG